MKGENFYSTTEGVNNARILGNLTPKLITNLVENYGPFVSSIIMGYGDGETVFQCRSLFSDIRVIEASEKLVKEAKDKINLENLGHIKVSCNFFEDYHINKPVDLILGNHILEHVDDPKRVLIKSLEWLKPKGMAIFTVPNGNSLHRRIGVKLGIIGSTLDLNQTDIKVGHQRVYDTNSFISTCKESGYNIIEHGGYGIKLVSQKQMYNWSDQLISAIYDVSRNCSPEICSNLYVICEKK